MDYFPKNGIYLRNGRALCIRNHSPGVAGTMIAIRTSKKITRVGANEAGACVDGCRSSNGS